MRMAGNSNLSASTRMSEAVSENPFLLLLLEHLDIDLPLQEKSLGEVSSENGIDTDLFLTFVNLYGDMNHAADMPFTGREVPSIIRYLKNSHRYYSEEVYPGIMETIRGISLSENSEETRMIEKFFLEYLAEVKNHFDYEEQTVFPYIVQLNERLTGKHPETGKTGYSVSEYREHHDDIEEKLDDLKSLLIEYLPLKEGRQVRRRLLFRLYELEHDLRIHSGIEDHILIPLVATMEARINKRN
jgi:regulator of cell morphogenesis and NO signaling